MTRIKQRIVETLDTVAPDELLTLYSVVCSFASGHPVRPEIGSPQPDIFVKVRKALGGCRGTMADDVRQLREDRV